MQRVEERISDGRILGLLRSWLAQDVLRDTERWTPTEGTPQGAVISPLLANIYLHPLDQRMAARGYRMVGPEERRAGTECRSRWAPHHYKKNNGSRRRRRRRSRTH